MIRAVAFDVMDTLLADPFRDALWAATGLTLAELAERRPRDAHPAFERGELTEPEYWAAFRGAGIEVDPAVYHRVRRAGTVWLDGMDELLDDLAGRVVRVAATNYPVWVEELAEHHLDGRVELVVSSHQLGVRKPDAGFYSGLLEAVGLPASQVLFVDDRQVNVVGAEAVGVRSHRFADAGAVRAWLADQGVLDDASR